MNISEQAIEATNCEFISISAPPPFKKPQVHFVQQLLDAETKEKDKRIAVVEKQANDALDDAKDWREIADMLMDNPICLCDEKPEWDQCDRCKALARYKAKRKECGE